MSKTVKQTVKKQNKTKEITGEKVSVWKCMCINAFSQKTRIQKWLEAKKQYVAIWKQCRNLQMTDCF